jgi:hypothetical protein
MLLAMAMSAAFMTAWIHMHLKREANHQPEPIRASAASLLQENGVVFEIKEEKEKKEVYPAGGWSGPFSIWIRDEHAALASSLLVPHFAKPS